MELVAIVIAIALIQYFVFGMLVGRARGKYNVEAPATTGDPIFERYNRVHQNTQESLLLFVPGMVMFGFYASANIACILGIIWIIGRVIYLRSYVKAPASRTLGFVLTMLPNLVLVIGGGIAAAL
ncbi:MAG: MAPEG family protein [Gammaproteobacteria bacterium]|nr:MAPEG family protein [Gammaproteobacteria bacterium]